jgi:O-antigen ligase
MSFRRPRAFLEGKLPSPARTGPPQAVALAAPPISLGRPAVVAAPAVPIAIRPAPEGNQPVVRIGSALMSFFLFIYFSRLLDVTSKYTLALHIPMFLMIGLMVMALAAGGVWRLAASRIGIFEMLFVVWVGVATAFSSWRSGSVLVYRDCLYSAMVFFVILTLVRNMAQLARVARAMAFAGLAAAAFSFVSAQAGRGGRVSVDIGTLADPNEYALILLMTLPYWWLVARNATNTKLMGTISCIAAVPILVAFFRTGSRAGLLTLIGLVVAVFFRCRPAQRFALVVTVLIVSAVAGVTLPNNLRERYVTWFSSDATDENFSADIASTEARRYFLVQSLKLTLEHPLLGVGPGQFAGTNWEVSRAAGVHIAAQPTHNTYTEVSSETGIPGLILFVGTLILSFRSTYKIAKLTQNKESLKALSNTATCIFVSVVAFLVGAFFLSLSYSPLVTVALGLSVALQSVAADEFGIVVDKREQVA